MTDEPLRFDDEGTLMETPYTDVASGITSDDLEGLGFVHNDTLILPPSRDGSYRPRLFLSKPQREAMLIAARESLGPDAHWHYDPSTQARYFREADEHFGRPDWATFIHVNRERCP